jgi:hypothetical protein
MPQAIHIAIKYQEFPARPVRTQPIGCGCGESHCEHSRWCEGFEVVFLTECPSSHQSPPLVADLYTGAYPTCPPCPDDPWVVLAKITMNTDGTIANIGNCACRRLVASYGNFWWSCSKEGVRDSLACEEEKPASAKETKRTVRSKTGSGSENLRDSNKRAVRRK